jgi:transposase
MYRSDLTDAQWAKLEVLLRESEPRRHAGGRPRKYPLRQVTDAVLYVVKTGCQWRQLPVDFPPWQTVYQQFRAWRLRGTWERVTKSLREQGRKAGGRSPTPTVAIIDSQSAKTALKGGDGVTMQAKRSKGASGTSRSTRKAMC